MSPIDNPVQIHLSGNGFDHDPNYCRHCRGYTRINPKCLHPHKLTRLVLYIKCLRCGGNGELPEESVIYRICSDCYGKGYTYDIPTDDELRQHPDGQIVNGRFEPYSNRL